MISFVSDAFKDAFLKTLAKIQDQVNREVLFCSQIGETFQPMVVCLSEAHSKSIPRYKMS